VNAKDNEGAPRMIRAVRVSRLGAIENGKIERIPYPVPGPDEVLVEIHAAPVNYVDLLTLEGKYQFHPPLPYTPGKGPAGIVAQIGSEVDDLDVGDRVLAMAEYGGFAEATVVEHRQVHRLPDTLDLPGAAAMSLAFDTAWMALRDRAQLAQGESVLVLGASGAVGGATVQLARAMGASLVLAGLTSPERMTAAPFAGMVDGIVDLGRPNLRDSIRDEVFQLTEGEGVDVIIDTVGGDAFDGGVRALAWRGRFVVVGFASGTIATLKSNYVLLKNIAVSGLQISDYRKRMPELVTRAFQEIFELVESGQVQIPAYQTMPLDNWADALQAIQKRSADRRLILQPLP
jgi:NADPH2:quinone reductase